MSSALNTRIWERIASIFDRALDVREEERRELLDQLCGSDETIRREVEGMLDAHEKSPGLIAERRLVVSGAAELPNGTRVGPYRIVTPLGAGGMGDVYRAERADGSYRQTVALKVLRPGYRTAEMVRRFRIEREALARLAHPGIATILDGGALQDGRPYIVLEYVDGVPATAYCATHALSLKERLTLFLRIVSAVQFAHGRLVVHRDLKPSNILVQRDGTPRLLDFGIAKLLDVDADASLAGPTTTPEARLLTPEYAAPEQLRGEAVTTATDVYALGVLLFEMLAGAKPFPSAGRSLSALEEAVVRQPAPAPSSVARSASERRRLRGDLDRIVLMALRKEPERRYASAAQFGEDVQRYLSGLPIAARPDSMSYRVGKFVRRNRALVAFGTSIALLLLGFGTTITFQARRLSRERDRAERERIAAEDVLGILTGLFERADPNKHPGGDTVRVTSLVDDAERAIDRLKSDPARQAALQRTVGHMRAARGEGGRALELLTSAYELRRRHFGDHDIETARLHHEVARAVLAYRGDAAARPVLDSSLSELRRLLGDDSPDVREAMNDLLTVTFDSLAARSLTERLAELDRVSPASDPIAIAERLNTKATERLNAGRTREAVGLFQTTLDILRKRLPPEHSDVRTVQRNLSMALYDDRQYARAEAMQHAAVALEERLRNSMLSLAMAREALALTLFAQHKVDSAERYERGALDAFRAGAAPEHWRIWSAQRNLAFMAAAGGRVNEALALLDSAIATASAGVNVGVEAAYLTAQRVPFLLRLGPGRLPDAAQAIAAAERGLGASPTVSKTHRADVNRYAGMMELASGRPARAIERFRMAMELSASPGDSTREASSACLLGIALTRAGRTGQARPLLAGPCTLYLSMGSPDSLIVDWVERARRRLSISAPLVRLH